MTVPVKFILWTNGQVMAFDAEGNQVPEWQGRGTEIIPRIRKQFAGAVIEGMDWKTDMQPGMKWKPR